MKYKILTYLVLISFIPYLQACLPMVAAGAAGGTAYFVGKKANSREEKKIKTESLVKARQEMEEQEKEFKAADVSIQNELNQRLVTGAMNTNMAVYPESKNGVMILHGRVPDAKTAERVIKTARSTPGVSRIISNLVIVNQQGQAPQAVGQQRQQFANPQQMQQQQIQQQQYLQQQRMLQQQQLLQQQRQYLEQQRKLDQQRQQMQQQRLQTPPPSITQKPNGQEVNNKKKDWIRAGETYAKKEVKKPDKDDDDDSRAKNRPPPKVMSEEMLKLYSDNDSAYKIYEPPTVIRQPVVQRPIIQQPVFQPQPTAVPVVQNPYVINVPTPTFDNDSLYQPPDTGLYDTPTTAIEQKKEELDLLYYY